MSEVHERLAAAEVPQAVLRRDPSGRSWLGAPAEDPASAPAIARFVEGERALFDDADVGADPLFTARVLASLPQRPVGAGLTPRRRLAVLGSAYLAATLVGMAVLDSGSTTVAAAASMAGGMLDVLDGTSTAAATALGCVLVLAVIALFARTAHTEPA